MSEASEKTASQLIDEKIGTLNDWRGPVLGRMRQLIREADPDVVEEITWRKPSNAPGHGEPASCQVNVLTSDRIR